MPRVLLRAGSSATGEAPVLDGLGDVRCPNLGAVGEIGNGSCNLENAMPGSRRKIELGGGLFEQLAAGVVRGTCGIDLGCAQAGIRLLLSRRLACPGGIDTLAYAGRAFTVCLADQVIRRQRRHFDEQVDAVEEGAGELAAITGDLVRRATALSVRCAVMAAGAGIHRGNQLRGC